MKYTLLTVLLSAVLIGSAQKEKKDYVKDIKEGALLFRMTTNLKKMQALRDANKSNAADELRDQTLAQQARWKEAFTQHYDFSAVYFFNDYDAMNISEGSFDGYLFDAGGELVKGFSGPFVVAGMSGSEDLDIDGLILLDPNMEELPKNTPNFISAYKNMRTSRKTEAELVIDLNKILHKRSK